MNLFEFKSVCKVLKLLPVFAVTMLLMALVVQEADAQNRPRRPEITINVTSPSATECLYEILDYPDQDTFRVAPGGKVTFSSTDVDIAVSIEKHQNKDNPDHPDHGNQGVARRADANFELPAGQSRTVTAKADNSGKTSHKIWIDCLVNGNEIGSKSVGGPAYPGDPSQSLIRIPAKSATPIRGNSIDITGDDGSKGSSVDPPKRAEGGPGMEVDPDE